ncbi:hypothetical protein [Paraburkholderia dilworthii]|uniref:hypothetical protein n=1 Tax=Paraburkholderia dilworthii TaxID=948106 RepID=UPI0004895C13|nr:hypothetical protein [Paraburkholderia dilworthii]
MDGYPAELVTHNFALPGMQAVPTSIPGCWTRCLISRMHTALPRAGPGRAVERYKKTTILPSCRSLGRGSKLTANQSLMEFEQVSPAAIAEAGGSIGGCDDVRK